MASPKQNFLLQKEKAERFGTVTKTDLFREASDVAMLEFVDNIGEGTDALTSAAKHYKLLGAKEYRRTLETISDTNAKTPITPTGLKYQ